MKFDLIIPTLNEIDGMKVILPEIDRTLFEKIIVVDGRSTDGTIEFSREQGLDVLIQPGRGVPDAEEFALINSNSEGIIIFTPDGNSLPELLPRLCDELRKGYDMVIASRYLDGAKSADDDFLTGIGNWIFTKLVNLMFRGQYSDVLVGLRAYRRDAIEKMRLVGMGRENSLRQRYFYMNSWELGSCLRASRLGLRIMEFPGDEPKRIGGERKLSILKNGSGAFLQLLTDFFFFHPADKVCTK